MKMARKIVQSGIVGLDDLIGGGFQKGKTYLVSGEAGCGKTIFCMQYVLQGLSQGENAIYITIDEKPEHLIEDAESLGWNLDKYIQSDKLLLLDLTPQFSELRAGKGGPNIERVISEIQSQVDKMSAERLVIDPVAPMFVRLENEFTIHEYLRMLIFSLDELGSTNIITSYVPTGTNRISRFGVEEFFASGIILLGIARSRDMYERTLLVRKMRGTPISLGVHTFNIDREKGIWVV